MANSSDKKQIRNILGGIGIAVFCVCFALLQWFPLAFSIDELHNAYINGILARLSGVIALVLLFHVLDIKLLGNVQKPLFLLPCIAIALNNFQWWSYFNGMQSLVRANALDVVLFATYCLSVGLFEEFLFRGVLFSLLASVLPRNKRGLIYTIVVSSVIFGLAHLFGGNVLQVGYSVLTGAFFAFVLIKTQNLWCSALIHALFNACGLFMDTQSNLGLGTGVHLWNLGTILTMGIGILLAIAYITFFTLKYKEKERKNLYIRLGIEEN